MGDVEQEAGEDRRKSRSLSKPIVLLPDVLADQDQIVGETEIQDLKEFDKRHACVSLGDWGAALGDLVALILLADPNGVSSTVDKGLHQCTGIRDALFSRAPREETAGVQLATFDTVLGFSAYLARCARCFS
jgi:hypothetical protein